MDGGFDYNGRRWKRLSERVKRRDGYRCVWCRRYGRNVAAAVVHHIKPAGDYPELAYRADNLEAAISLIRSGKGVALGSPSFEAHYHVAAVPMVPADDVELCLICLRQNQNNSLVMQLGQHLLACVRARQQAERD